MMKQFGLGSEDEKNFYAIRKEKNKNSCDTLGDEIQFQN